MRSWGTRIHQTRERVTTWVSAVPVSLSVASTIAFSSGPLMVALNDFSLSSFFGAGAVAAAAGAGAWKVGDDGPGWAGAAAGAGVVGAAAGLGAAATGAGAGAGAGSRARDG